MLKQILLFMCLACFVGANAQGVETMALPVDEDTHLISYKDVIPMAGTADELYIRAIEWVNTRYKNPADVCRIRNRESGVIEIAHRFEIINDVDGSKLIAGIVNYNLKLEFKPGRYRYSLSDLILKQSTRFPIERWMDKEEQMYSPLWESYLKQVNEQSIELINSLKSGMEPPVVKQEETW